MDSGSVSTQSALWVSGAIAAVGLTLTFWLAQHQRAADHTLAQLRFAEEVRFTSQAVAQRVRAYQQIVAGMHDLFRVDPALSRDQFIRIATEQNVRQDYPEIHNLVFVRSASAIDAASPTAYGNEPPAAGRLRASPDAKDDDVYGDDDVYFVDYVWPEKGNEAIAGLNIATQPANVAALLTARVSGHPSLSAPFELLQAPARTGIVLYQPVFGLDVGQATQQPSFLGAVRVLVDPRLMLRSLQMSGALRAVSLHIDDIGSVSTRDPAVQPQRVAQFTDEPPDAAMRPMAQIIDLPVLGRVWQLTFEPSSTLVTGIGHRLARWITGAGIVLTLLLAALVNLVLRQRVMALERARQSDVARANSDERFRTIFNQAAVGVVLTDATTGRLEQVNQRYCDIMRYTAGELLQLGIRELIHPDDLAPTEALLEQLQSGAIPDFRIELRAVRKDDTTMWISLAVSPVRLPHEARPKYYIAVIQDITARRSAQDSLRESQDLLLDVLDHLPVGVLLVRNNQKIVFHNDRLEEIFGFADTSIPDEAAWWAMVCPEPRRRGQMQAHWNALCTAARKGDGLIEPAHYELVAANGEPRFVTLSGTVLSEGYLVTVDDLTQRRAAEEQISYLSRYDPLTNLPNRRLLRDHVQQALIASVNRKRWGALVLIDIDHFKVLNETRGHDAGDQLLRQVAGRLRATCQDDRAVGRHGDDEFVLILQGLGTSEAGSHRKAGEMARRILDTLRTPYALDGMPYHATVSMGIALFEGTSHPVDELLKRADLAVYQAKAAGRNSMQFYDPDTDAAVSAQAALELDMRIALEHHQFRLFFQPQVQDDAIIGAEALLRWPHPDRGFVPPAEFVSLAEKTGLIEPLGHWVLQTACRQLALWATQPEFQPLTLSVNVSPHQFFQSDFVERVLAVLGDTGAPPSRLVLELTESLLLRDIEDTIAKMAELNQHGVRFSLDDFGTGYSSLAYLRRLPLQELKIDQSFVRDVLTDAHSATIARTIVALAGGLGLDVIAEGVETQEQLEFLRAHDCHAWQGYLFSKAVPLAAFETHVRTRGAASGQS